MISNYEKYVVFYDIHTKYIQFINQVSGNDWMFEVQRHCTADTSTVMIDQMSYNRIMCYPAPRKIDVLFDDNRHYHSHPNPRPFSADETKRFYYEDYIEFNLRNMLDSGLFEARFVPIREMQLQENMISRGQKAMTFDPYLQTYGSDRLKLARSILEIGTYWPTVACVRNGKYVVYEGTHRITSLKLFAMLGEIDDSFELLCLIPKSNRYFGQNDAAMGQFHLPCKYRYVIDDVWGHNLYTNETYRKNVIRFIEDHGGKMVDEYTAEVETSNIDNLIEWFLFQPMFIRDLIFIYCKDLKPSKIINNKEAFERWYANA